MSKKELNNEQNKKENPPQTDPDHPETNMIDYENVITTPYERVLSVIDEAKTFVKSNSKTSNDNKKLIDDLEWVIKVITSHSLYAFELKESLVDKISAQNPEFKEFVDFISKYNEEMIEMNKKSNLIGSASAGINNEYLKPSSKLQRIKLPAKVLSNKNVRGIINLNELLNSEKKNNNDIKENKDKDKTTDTHKSKNKQPKKNKNVDLIKKVKEFTLKNNLINEKKQKFLTKSKTAKTQIKNSSSNDNTKNIAKTDDDLDSSFNAPKKNPIRKIFSYVDIINSLFAENFDPKKILTKSFNIFELKKIIGYENVLPLMGKTILDTFGLTNEKIINPEKLDSFLLSIQEQYFKTTLYHNAMHGADVTQMISLIFLNSNAEEICETSVLDLLGILVAALGHDLGHPGLTNNFQINALSKMAITYNDISCLENFHLCGLFKTLRKSEYDIFEKLNVQEFKTIRKRMISEILATDMANHGKIMTCIKSKLTNIKNSEKFVFLTGNEKTKFEEQQNLYDLIIHASDLAHNTRLFRISLKWVELLSEEFWLQGDKEKSMNLPVSFLCDRKDYNIPQSQIGFIKGFIIPTFECVVKMFPTLKFTIENAQKNLNEWKKLSNQKRLKGWTPKKNRKEEDEIKKNKLFDDLKNLNLYNNNTYCKRGNRNKNKEQLNVAYSTNTAKNIKKEKYMKTKVKYKDEGLKPSNLENKLKNIEKNSKFKEHKITKSSGGVKQSNKP